MSMTKLISCLAAVAALAGCGGGGADRPSGSPEAARPLDDAAMAAAALGAARNRSQGRSPTVPTQQLSSPEAARAEAAALVAGRTGAAPAAALPPRVAAVADPESCLARLTARLASASVRAGPQESSGLRCTAGTYHGHTPQQGACTLKVATIDADRFRFTLTGNDVLVENDDAAPSVSHKLLPLSPKADRRGLQLLRAGQLPDTTVESVTLNSGASGIGPARLLEMKYARSGGAPSLEVTCRFVATEAASERDERSVRPAS